MVENIIARYRVSIEYDLHYQDCSKKRRSKLVTEDSCFCLIKGRFTYVRECGRGTRANIPEQRLVIEPMFHYASSKWLSQQYDSWIVGSCHNDVMITLSKW